ncbi:RES family NAD+ phosphorylase [Marinibaculum pumilum]|uniref:RES family NAD+ phosphorylase n=1 Tax=Marinibaculum pumilum TaxID=1766165 RepID=A0ABV7L9P3_9PROT
MTDAVPAVVRISWSRAWRIIRAVFPPIALFEDIADPADWEAIASAEAKTNPRVAETVGMLDLVPPARRIAGPGASWVMAPFVHASPDRPSRFSDGRSGVYYAGSHPEVAIFETIHHHSRFMAATRQDAGWTSEFRELVGPVDAELHDLRDDPVFAVCLDPNDYAPAQALGARLRDEGADGVVYPSVRWPAGSCVAAFWPDVVGIPRPARHFAYHWDGQSVDLVRELPDGPTFRIEGGPD